MERRYKEKKFAGLSRLPRDVVRVSTSDPDLPQQTCTAAEATSQRKPPKVGKARNQRRYHSSVSGSGFGSGSEWILPGRRS